MAISDLFSSPIPVLLLVIAVVWIYQFSFLMLLEHSQFPGPYDKFMWVTAFLLAWLFTPFAFILWKKAILAQKVPENTPLPRIGGRDV
jgi:branched-subunit amino acid transport protein